ncbi:cytidine deaminase [Piptocephalis cylindrospora]|uniref:Cytidine deaminase n=1 Tax=Piptocephalis cylindrospora TaxID=1907219 RepID=A0A4P9Y3M0_9FUNG|nr:cytidine deaminase [Piptocephalis cylindrospora]|eukprot:RKP13242.1 cytidine deaminase [Piptocephalis cylindrospora]
MSDSPRPEIPETHKADMIQASLKARESSYSPYSKFRVGAALLTQDKKIYTGCNIENASFGAAICAERTAFVKAVSEGHREFIGIAVATDRADASSPCGICRQFMREFGPHLAVLLVNPDGQATPTSLAELFPMAFSPDDL